MYRKIYTILKAVMHGIFLSLLNNSLWIKKKKNISIKLKVNLMGNLLTISRLLNEINMNTNLCNTVNNVSRNRSY